MAARDGGLAAFQWGRAGSAATLRAELLVAADAFFRSAVFTGAP